VGGEKWVEKGACPTLLAVRARQNSCHSRTKGEGVRSILSVGLNRRHLKKKRKKKSSPDAFFAGVVQKDPGRRAKLWSIKKFELIHSGERGEKNNPALFKRKEGAKGLIREKTAQHLCHREGSFRESVLGKRDR